MERVLISGFIVTIQHPVSQAVTHSHLGTGPNTQRNGNEYVLKAEP